jgi:hypothetical protein
MGEGASFSKYYTTASTCAPCRLALLTSRYPSRAVHVNAETPSAAKSATGLSKVSVPNSAIDGDDMTQVGSGIMSMLYAVCGCLMLYADVCVCVGGVCVCRGGLCV